MIIECPSCRSKYQYDEDRFERKASKKIKCARCQKIFAIHNPAFEVRQPAAVQVGDRTTPGRSERTPPLPEATDQSPLPQNAGALEGALQLPAGKRLSLAILEGPDAGSVSTVAFSLARLLGCSPIVMVGQDLAYSGGRTYATGTGYESSEARVCQDTGVIHLAWNEEALRVHGETQGAHRTEEPLRRVPAWGGRGEVDSGAGFANVQT